MLLLVCDEDAMYPVESKASERQEGGDRKRAVNSDSLNDQAPQSGQLEHCHGSHERSQTWKRFGMPRLLSARQTNKITGHSSPCTCHGGAK